MTETTISTIAADPAAVLEPLTVDQYHSMIREGILVEGASIELLDGFLVRKDRRDTGGSIMTVGPRHARILMHTAELLRQLFRDRNVHVREQQPATLGAHQEPEPDIVVAAGRVLDYVERHPGPEDLLLVIEVADSSLSTDRNRKLSIYAIGGVTDYWIIDLSNDCVEAFAAPDAMAGRYDSVTRHDSGDQIVLVVSDEPVTLAIDEIFAV